MLSVSPPKAWAIIRLAAWWVTFLLVALFFSRQVFVLFLIPFFWHDNQQDLDAAFTRGVSRDANSTGAPITNKDTTTSTTNGTTATAETKENADAANTLSLSGLLNSLDGVAAAEGR